LFSKNAQFRIVLNRVWIKNAPAPTVVDIYSKELLAKNRLWLNSTSTIEESIQNLWMSINGSEFTSHRPRLLTIFYTVTIRSSIEDLRVLNIRASHAKEVDKRWKRTAQKAEYRLFCAVRIGDRDEKVQGYSNEGKEVIQAGFGDYKSKEPDAEGAQWTVKEPGEYILLYYKEDVPDEEFPQPKSKETPEWERRPWMLGELPAHLV
jgi:hypothetical protein